MTHPFEVGKMYRNRVGEYMVVSIDDDQMKIRYTDGKTLMTNASIQARIWENIQFEERQTRAEERRRLAQEERTAARKQIRELKARPAFAGFQEEDFQAKERGISWTGRQALGRALAYELRRRTRRGFAFWAVPRLPAVNLALKDRYAPDSSDRNASLFVAVAEEGVAFGLRVSKAEGEVKPSWPWSILLSGLDSDVKLRDTVRSVMKAQNLALEIYALRLEYGLAGRVTVQGDGFLWEHETADQHVSREVDWTGLLEQVKDLAVERQSELRLCQNLPRDAALQAGADAAQVIATVLEVLVPLYDACAK